MKKVFLLLTVAVFMFACGNQAKTDAENDATADSTNVENEEMVVIKAHELMAQAGDFVEKEVMVEGTAVHVCAHGGKRMFLVSDTTDERLKVTAGEDIGAFKQEDVGGEYVVTGVVKEMKVDEEYLNNWEKEIKEESGDEHHIHDGKHGEGETHHEHDAATDLAKVEAMRTELKESGKDHLSFYSIEAKSYKKK